MTLAEKIYDYLTMTNHGDTGAYVGEDLVDDDGNPRPGVIRFDGIIDTNELAAYLTVLSIIGM